MTGASQPASAETRRPLERVLIADDDPTIVLLMEHAVQALGRSCDVADDGESAWLAWEQTRHELVLLDIEMPGMDGVAALRGIHAIDATIPVIMVTGNESTRVAGEVIKDGAFSYLPKPVKFQYLDHLVASALRPAD